MRSISRVQFDRLVRLMVRWLDVLSTGFTGGQFVRCLSGRFQDWLVHQSDLTIYLSSYLESRKTETSRSLVM